LAVLEYTRAPAETANSASAGKQAAYVDEWFKILNNVVRQWSRNPEGAMKEDAFDDVRCPFNYKAELKRVRRALNAKVGRYISGNPMTSYRELAKAFNISPGAVCAIAKWYKLKRNPGRRHRRPRSLDDATVPLPSNVEPPPDLP
jgi:hypothetical protein